MNKHSYLQLIQLIQVTPHTMAFKNPANISSLDDETCAKVALHGTYYSDARTRYLDIVAVVRCDKCGLCPLACSIGFESYDLCLPCANNIRAETLSVQELETDLSTRTAALQVDGHTVYTGLVTQCNATASTPNSRPPHVGLEFNVDGHTEATTKQAAENLEYIMSNIQCGTVREMYNYLNKLANSEPSTFRLTTDEAQILSEYCAAFLSVNVYTTDNRLSLKIEFFFIILAIPPSI